MPGCSHWIRLMMMETIQWVHARYVVDPHARIQKVFSKGSKFDNVLFCFFSWWGDRGSKYHYKLAIIGPQAKRHLNGVSLAGRCWPNIECWPGSFVIIQGIQSSVAKKPNIFVYFQGGRAGSPAPLMDPPIYPPPPPTHTHTHEKTQNAERENPFKYPLQFFD